MKKQLFNDQWQFCSDIAPEFKDVRLPHDAMQTEKRVPGLKEGSGTGFYPGGIYTYTKAFHWDGAAQTALLEFEGVYGKTSVFLNGEKLSTHVYGYTGFYADLTEKLLPGENQLKVLADNSQVPNSRWYSGAGIYRDVNLYTAGKEYIRPDGIRVTTASIAPATVLAEVDAVKAEDTEIRIQIFKDDCLVCEGYGEKSTLVIPNALLWSAETPELYDIRVSLVADGNIIDEACDCFGIRSLSWDSAKGFQVNGNTVKLRGGCVHHDHGVIGSVEYDAASVRKIRIMKEAGFNAVRIAHHPASRAMLRACDRVGMYVMNETFDTWLNSKNPYDYSMYFAEYWRQDVKDMIRVSYNHPSVVMYCIGNEIFMKNIETASAQTREMVDFCHTMDPSRPVINSLNPMMVVCDNPDNPEKNRNDIIDDPRAVSEESSLVGSKLANTMISAMPIIMRLCGNEKALRKHAPTMDPLDIVGLNYADFLYDPQHKDYPNRVLCGSETFPQQIGSNWPKVVARPWVVGDFLWTAWDYLGESGIGTVSYEEKGMFTQPFPVIAAGCANIDLTGDITCQGYYTAIVYGTYKKPYIAVRPLDKAGKKRYLGQWRFTDAVHSWTWHGFEGTSALVDVYANAPVVELFQDGKSLGKKKTKNCMATFKVTYKAGKLEAAAAGETDVLETASTAAQICLKPEKDTLTAGGKDLLYLPVEIVDEKGIRQIGMDRNLTIHVSGAAELIGFGSASLVQESLTPFTGTTAPTYQGRILAILRSADCAGPVSITVSAEGMNAQTVALETV